LRYFGAAMRCSTLRRSVVPAVLLAVTLSAGASLNAVAADAGSRDVQVNLDVLDSLGPAPAASTSGASEIRLHPPRPKIKATPAVATAPQRPTRAPAPQQEAAPKPTTETAAATAPPSAGNESAPASAAPPPAATPTPSAPPAAAAAKPPATAMAAPAAAKPASPASPAAAPNAPPPTRLLFAAGATDLPNGAKPKLDAVAQWLDTNLQARIQVIAYAAGSTEQANEARRTSLSRALAVRSYLADHGIATIRMEVRALGNHSAEGEPLDRVDILPMDR
jgi:outer membrane protein OmpA-like peptidoglycan-associated protein